MLLLLIDMERVKRSDCGSRAKKTPSVELGVLGRNRAERQSELLGWDGLISNQDGDQDWVAGKRTCWVDES